MKEESGIRNEEKDQLMKEDFEERKKVVEAVLSQKENALKEMEKVKEDKRRIRDEVNKELTEAMQRKKEEENIPNEITNKATRRCPHRIDWLLIC